MPVTSMSAAWWQDEPVTPLRRSVPEWRSIVMDAYATLPSLSLTRPQGQRLWGMDAPTCGYVLDSLVDAGMLICTSTGQYCRADALRPIDPVFTM
ncbi:hypothetical protein [Luteitalea sp. TBR-22]|uniref:hypothetical protein n=1 Tax=Luteitalea sp. TBR-22 TaxID=2802971 RepID=UPI001EF4670F|nr:hypothetical protein [Luteitalea sp. TBR-22]